MHQKEKFCGFKRYSITLGLAYMWTLKRKTFFYEIKVITIIMKCNHTQIYIHTIYQMSQYVIWTYQSSNHPISMQFHSMYCKSVINGDDIFPFPILLVLILSNLVFLFISTRVPKILITAYSLIIGKLFYCYTLIGQIICSTNLYVTCGKEGYIFSLRQTF